MAQAAATTKSKLSSPLGLIAGNGRFPLEFAKSARAKGFSVIAVAHVGETDQSIADLVTRCEWIKAGQLGNLISIFKKNGVGQATFAGGLTRAKLFRGLVPDMKAILLMARLRSLKDDVVLRGIAEEMEQSGIIIFSAGEVLTENIPHSGVLSARGLSSQERENALIGWEAARLIGSADIGQTVVVNQKTIVAVEAAEGTDRAIARAGEVSGPGAVVVKLCKPQQDLRFDLPAVGEVTIDSMIKAGATALVLEAERSLLLNPDEVMRRANQAGIAVVAASSEEDLRGN